MRAPPQPPTRSSLVSSHFPDVRLPLPPPPFKNMAANRTCINLRGIISVFKILSNTDRSKAVDLASKVATTNSFDHLLMLNLHLVRYELENNESLKDLQELRAYLSGYFETKSSSKEDGDALYRTEVEQTLPVSEHKQNKTTINLSETRITNNSSRDIRWIFHQISLQALCCLKKTLQAMKNSGNNAKDPAVDLSISDQQTVKTVIQLIVVLGICPNLLNGVGIPFEQRTGFSAALRSEQASAKCPKCLYECVMMLFSCLSEPNLSLVILSKHLADLLAAFIQLGYCKAVCDSDGVDQSGGPVTKQDDKQSKGVAKLAKQVNLVALKSEQQDKPMNDEFSLAKDSLKQDLQFGDKFSSGSICEGGIVISKIQQDRCRKALNDLVNKMYQPLIIRELLFLQGSMSEQKTSPSNLSVRTENTGAKGMSPKTLPSANESNTVNEESGCLKGNAATRTPKWVKDICGHLLSKCLIKKNGVQSVLRAVLEGAPGL